MSEHSLATVNVSGDDAFEFLQNQLTNDLQRLSAEAEILAAWCNPKGRVIWFGTIRKTDSGYAMSVPAATAEDLVRRLTMFRFRAKVEFSVDEGGTVDAGLLIENGYPFVGREQAGHDQVEQCQLQAGQDDPDDVHHDRHAAPGRLLFPDLAAEGRDRQPGQLEALNPEGYADDGDAQDQRTQQVADHDDEAAEDQPDDVEQ